MNMRALRSWHTPAGIDAYLDGNDAGHLSGIYKGLTRHPPNPYQPGSIEFDGWQYGFNEAAQDKAETREFSRKA
jgi:hypothetical protein